MNDTPHYPLAENLPLPAACWTSVGSTVAAILRWLDGVEARRQWALF